MFSGGVHHRSLQFIVETVVFRYVFKTVQRPVSLSNGIEGSGAIQRSTLSSHFLYGFLRAVDVEVAVLVAVQQVLPRRLQCFVKREHDLSFASAR